MSGTPETDAEQHEGLLRTNPIPMQVVTANFARKLERERDEAREDLEFRRGLYKVQEEYLEAARRDLAEAQIECLEQARLLSMSSEREAKLIYERDEARSVAGAMADIAFKHLTSLLASTPHSKDTAHEEETQEVIAAIKQWKELKK